MPAREDFGSGARSPGGWGGQGNMRTTVGGGGHGSLGGASGSNASGMGGIGGVGGGYGYQVRPEAMAYLPRGAQRTGGLLGDEFVQQGPLPSLKLPPGAPAVPAAYPTGGFTPSIETAPQGIPADSGYFDMREALGYNPYSTSSSWSPGVMGGGGVFGVNPGNGGQLGSFRGTYSNQSAQKTSGLTKDQSRVPQDPRSKGGYY